MCPVLQTAGCPPPGSYNGRLAAGRPASKAAHRRHRAAVVLAALPLLLISSAAAQEQINPGSRTPPPVSEEPFAISFEHGQPSAIDAPWSWESPELLQLARQEGYDADDMLTAAGMTMNDFLQAAAVSFGDVIGWVDAKTDDLLPALGMTTDDLLDAIEKDADWLLSEAGKNYEWLFVYAGVSADQLLDWGDRDADWLLGALGKSADWVLDRSGYSIEWLIGAAGKGTSWVAGIVKDALCGNLDGLARGVCNKSVDAVSGSISSLLGLLDKTADWWLEKTGNDIDWLLGATGKSADWMLAEAGRNKTWLLGELNKDADWVLQNAGHGADWLLSGLGKDADWILARAGKTQQWLLQQGGKDAAWLLSQSGHGLEWVMSRLGDPLVDGELVAEIELLLQVVTGRGIALSYPATARLQYVPLREQLDPAFAFEISLATGNIEMAEGLGASTATATLTYTHDSGVYATAGGDLGMLNQDLAIVFNEQRQLYRQYRHADDWLMTFCIPVKEIVAVLAVEVPPASAAAMVLLPDIVMQVYGDAGFRLNNERVNPQPGTRDIHTFTEPQREFTAGVRYTADMYLDVQLTGGSFAFAWGLGVPCGPGISFELGASHDIEGGHVLQEEGPLPLTIDTPVTLSVPLPPGGWPDEAPEQPGEPIVPGQPGTVGTSAGAMPPTETAPAQQAPAARPPRVLAPPQPPAKPRPSRQRPTTPPPVTTRQPVSSPPPAAMPAPAQVVPPADKSSAAAGPAVPPVVNGNFSQGLAGWQASSTAGRRPGQYTVTTRDGTALLRRMQSRNSGGDASIFQQLDVPVRGPMHLALDLNVVHQSLAGGGYQGNEYPVHVVVRYVDDKGQQTAWRHGFYYSGRSVRPERSTSVPQNQWVSYRSPDLSGLVPRPVKLTGIRIYANGWDYESYVDNVRLE